MSTHNMCFCGEIRKIVRDYPSYLELGRIFITQAEIKSKCINLVLFPVLLTREITCVTSCLFSCTHSPF